MFYRGPKLPGEDEPGGLKKSRKLDELDELDELDDARSLCFLDFCDESHRLKTLPMAAVLQ